MPGEARPHFDVIVVGSGASGGWVGKRLAEAGAKVAMVEAGAPQSDDQFTEHTPPFELKYHNLAPQLIRKSRPIQSHLVCDEYTSEWFCNDLDEPYTTPPDKPYLWVGRTRVTGGQTNVWSRTSLRVGDLGFKAASRDGYGEDWPLSYKDLEPYYDLVEMGDGCFGELPSFGVRPTRGGPNRPAGIYVPCFRNTNQTPPSKTFLRGYGYEGGGSVDFHWSAPGFGKAYKQALLEPQVSMFLRGYGEVLPRWENQVEINKAVKDRFGIPVLHISMSNGPNEEAMLKDMVQSASEMLEAAGARNICSFPSSSRRRWAAHEGGTARMGSNPKTSVLNQYQQAHDIANLFVMDGSGFTTNPYQNPALTIMALCVRSSDYLMGEMKRGNI